MKIGTTIKELRKKKGYSLEELSEKSGLSSKTIQRLENDQSKGRGHSLQQLAKALEVNIEVITTADSIEQSELRNNSLEAVKKLYLSALFILFMPLTNLIFPLYFYKKHYNQILIREIGSKIITFNLLWFIVTSIALIAAPFILLLFNEPKITPIGSLIFTYLFFWLIQIIVTLIIAIDLKKNSGNLLKSWPSLL